jgi:RND family efflux transporter MFP subunit
MKMNFKLLAFALLLSACGGNKKDVTVTSNGAIQVKTETIKVAEGASVLHYSGTIEPVQTIPLSFQANGTVESVTVQAGDIVHKGQILATVDKADNQSLYDGSLAKYQQAKDAYDRLKSVHDKGSLTELKWVEMETNLKQAESQVQISKSSLDKCILRSPDNGMIGRRNVEPGQSSIAVNNPLELVKIETVLVKIAVPENEISKIQKGLKANFSISALNGQTFEGTITNVGIVADMISRTYEVKITVKNSGLIIKPGMVCDVTIIIGTQKAILLVPNSAVSKDNDGNPFVFVVSADKKSVRKQNIVIGNYQNTGIEVISGLTPNQTLVVEGKEKLSDNSLISL